MKCPSKYGDIFPICRFSSTSDSIANLFFLPRPVMKLTNLDLCRLPTTCLLAKSSHTYGNWVSLIKKAWSICLFLKPISEKSLLELPFSRKKKNKSPTGGVFKTVFNWVLICLYPLHLRCKYTQAVRKLITRRKETILTQFSTQGPFLYPLKTSENLVFWRFQGV